MPEASEGLLNRVAKRISDPPKYSLGEDGQSVLVLAAGAYSAGLANSNEEHTIPTGFDPAIAALFEAVVEGAFLVANADGVFDEREVATFKQVVVSACGGKVTEAQVEALVLDFADQLAEDGMDKRLTMVARTVARPEHAAEVLRIAGLLALVSSGVSEQERNVLERLARELRVGDDALRAALGEVERAIAAEPAS